MSALDVFSPKTRAWFEGAFEGATPAQELGWPAIASGGKDTLIQAPTGSGKTLAAFLYGIDRLTEQPGEGLRLLYVSPLKALNYDIERNLRGPLAGLDSKLRSRFVPETRRSETCRDAPGAPGHPDHDAGVALSAPDLAGREMLKSVETLILDEVHAVAGTKRGAHLALGRTARPPDREAGAADRPLGDSAADGRDRAVRLRRAADRARRRGPREGARPEGRRPLEDMREPGESNSI